MNTGEELLDEFDEHEEHVEFSDKDIQNVKKVFEDIWKDLEQEAKDMSKKELAFELFLVGMMIDKKFIEDQVELIQEQEKKNDSKS